jgi:hypothetical protein
MGDGAWRSPVNRTISHFPVSWGLLKNATYPIRDGGMASKLTSQDSGLRTQDIFRTRPSP